MSRVAKKAERHFKKVATLQQAKGAEAVTARRELKRMRDVYYSTDQFHPSAGAAWQPDGSRQARGAQGRAKKLLSGWNAKQKQGMNIGRK